MVPATKEKIKSYQHSFDQVLMEMKQRESEEHLAQSDINELSRYRQRGFLSKQLPDIAKDMLVGLRGCETPERVNQLLHRLREDLSSEGLSLLHLWVRVPWVYCGFRVVKDLGNNFLTIKPLGAKPQYWPESEPWDQILLYSGSVRREWDQGARLFMAVIWKSPECFHSYGLVNGLYDITEEDFFSFADKALGEVEDQQEPKSLRPQPIQRLLYGDTDAQKDLATIMTAHPAGFMSMYHYGTFLSGLDIISDLRMMVGAAQVYDPEILDATNVRQHFHIPDQWSIEWLDRVEGGWICSLDIQDLGSHALILYSADVQACYLLATHFETYQKLRTLVVELVDMPRTPQIRSSVKGYFIGLSLFAVEDPFFRLMKEFTQLLGKKNAQPRTHNGFRERSFFGDFGMN